MKNLVLVRVVGPNAGEGTRRKFAVPFRKDFRTIIGAGGEKFVRISFEIRDQLPPSIRIFCRRLQILLKTRVEFGIGVPVADFHPVEALRRCVVAFLDVG